VVNTQIRFAGAVLALALQRLAELRLSRRNEAQLLARGGREHAPGQMKIMKTLHFLWLLAMLGEVFGLRRRFRPGLALGAAAVVAAGQGLRYTAIRTLGQRWTVRIITLPEAAPVKRGIYRFIRHPNYLGVALEILAFPLLHGAFLTAAFFSLANALLLRQRIRAEEQALSEWNPGPC
jgi:methyltransferase